MKITVADAYNNDELLEGVKNDTHELGYRFGHRFRFIDRIEKVNETYYVYVPMLQYKDEKWSVYGHMSVRIKSTKELTFNEVIIAKPRTRREF